MRSEEIRVSMGDYCEFEEIFDSVHQILNGLPISRDGIGVREEGVD